MNEERGPPIGGLDSLVVFLLYYNIFYNNINCLCYKLSCGCVSWVLTSTSIKRFLTWVDFAFLWLLCFGFSSLKSVFVWSHLEMVLWRAMYPRREGLSASGPSTDSSLIRIAVSRSVRLDRTAEKEPSSTSAGDQSTQVRITLSVDYFNSLHLVITYLASWPISPDQALLGLILTAWSRGLSHVVS